MYLFRSSVLVSHNRIHISFSMLSSCVTNNMNERLIKEFTFDEVKRALDSTVDLKAHEPNGLSMIFFKKF